MPRVFSLTLRALGDEDDVPRRLRRALKTLLRRDKLRCISIEEINETAAGSETRFVMKWVENMATALTNTSDGFDGYNIDVDGKESKQSGLFRGERLKFGKSAEWETKEGEVVEASTRLIFLNIDRLLVRWGKEKGPPLETVVLAPGEKIPDVERPGSQERMACRHER
jgi:hypothetical protein